MNELDDVYDMYAETGVKEYNKEDYVEYKRAEKKQVYELLDFETKKITQDVNEFQKYLDNQSKFEQYSVGNALLITAQMPQATQLRDLDSWANLKVYKKKFAKPVKILEPRDSYMREDGSMATNYNVKKVYDISQVNSRQRNMKIKFNDKILLKILLNSSSSKIKVVDVIPDTEKKAFYDSNSDTLLVARGASIPNIFYEITEALGMQEIAENSAEDMNKAYCISYMICKKYDIPTEKYDFSKIISNFNGLETREIRAELEPIKNAIENISTRMSAQIQKIIKEKEFKENVR